MYGYCKCGAEIWSRTRGIPSYDTCEMGHRKNSAETVSIAPFKSPLEDLVFKHFEGDTYEYKPKTPNPISVDAILEKIEAEKQKKFVSPEPPPTAHQSEILDILIEECAEVIQRATKMKRFGVMEIQPDQPLTNAERLSQEVGDLFAILEHAAQNELLCEETLAAQVPLKMAKLEKFMQTKPETDNDNDR